MYVFLKCRKGYDPHVDYIKNMGHSWENDIASLRVFMATLRKKIETTPESPKYIQTHIGVGYRMLRVE